MRLEHTKLRFDRRQATLAAVQDDAQLEPTGVKGEMSCAGAPPENFPLAVEEDYEILNSDSDESGEGMQYSPASPGMPMFVAQLAAVAATGVATEAAQCFVGALRSDGRALGGYWINNDPQRKRQS